LKINLLNLDRSGGRLQAFRSKNSFLSDVERVCAIDGRTLDRRALIRDGILDPRLTYTDGALGCALSHMAIWDRVANAGSAQTIAEDDALFNKQFASRSTALIHSLADSWDCVLWGWNFDSVLVADILPGVAPALMHFDQAALRSQLDRFQSLEIEPRPLGLYRAFGTVCYSLTPQGARKLLAACRPMRPLSLSVPGLPAPLANYGLDVMMNAVYPQLKAFVAFPPLVVTPNDPATSLVRPGSP
jgi:glycosyl transferase, family 25